MDPWLFNHLSSIPATIVGLFKKYFSTIEQIKNNTTKIEMSRATQGVTFEQLLTSITIKYMNLLHNSDFGEGLLNSHLTLSLGSVIFRVGSKVGSSAREVDESFNAHFSGDFGNVASTVDVDLMRSEISARPPLSSKIDNDVANKNEKN